MRQIENLCNNAIFFSQFVFRTWKISLRNDAYIHPKEERDTHEDFLYNDRMQSTHIASLFLKIMKKSFYIIFLSKYVQV